MRAHLAARGEVETGFEESEARGGTAAKLSRDDTEGRREQRRRYNRNYMRRWRRHPQHAQAERENRLRAYMRAKLKGAEEPSPCVCAKPRQDVCGFCGRRAPITQVRRLKITAVSSEFVPINIPYCGQC